MARGRARPSLGIMGLGINRRGLRPMLLLWPLLASIHGLHGQQAAAPSVPSYCVGISHTPGILSTGKVWPSWVPVLNYSYVLNITSGASASGAPAYDSVLTASNQFIPDSLQGQVTDEPALCNQACCSVDACVGYTWLGGAYKQCWLHPWIPTFLQPAGSFLDPASPDMALTAVPADTVMARVVRGLSYVWPMCSNVTAFEDRAFAYSNANGLQPSVVDGSNSSACNQACATQPTCLGMQWMSVDVNGTIPHCQLLSYIPASLSYNEPDGGQHSFAAPLQSCVPVNMTVPPLTPTPDAPATRNTACVPDASDGVRYTGRVWPGWQPLRRAGWQLQDGASETAPAWSHRYLPDEAQGQVTDNATACNCKCAQLTACVGYTWLGGTYKQCWLHSWVQGSVDPVAQFTDAAGTTQAVPEDTVVGRVVTNSTWPACSDISIFAKRSLVEATPLDPASASSSPSAAGAQPYTWQSCNQACGQTAQCVAFSWAGPAANASATCTLYGKASGGLMFTSSPQAITFTAPLQTCQKYLVEQPLPPSPSPQDTAGASSDGGGKGVPVGVIAGAAAAGAVAALLVGFVAFYLHRRSRRPRVLLPGDDMSEQGPGSATPTSVASPRQRAREHGTPRSRKQPNTPQPMVIPGLSPGEVFTRATAFEYTWLGTQVDPEAAQPVEAGLNDVQLDALAARQGKAPPVVELSQAMLRKDIHLVKDGLLGRGATALVFQCVWPERFGPNALLAAKVLKDGYEVDALVLQSFAYEANVLASTDHPCVVRLYGYCLEPPTVCLILELLPCSLKDILYGPQVSHESSHRRLFRSSMLPPTASSVRGHHPMLVTGTGTGLTGHRSPLPPGSPLPGHSNPPTNTYLPPGSPMPAGSPQPTHMQLPPGSPLVTPPPGSPCTKQHAPTHTPSASHQATAEHKLPAVEEPTAQVSLVGGAGGGVGAEGEAGLGAPVTPGSSPPKSSKLLGQRRSVGIQLPLPPVSVPDTTQPSPVTSRMGHPSPRSAQAMGPLMPSSPNGVAGAGRGAAGGGPEGLAHPLLTSPSTAVGSPMAGGTKPSPLNMMQVLCIATDIAAGLAYLHDRTLLAAAGSTPRDLVPLEGESRTHTTFATTRLDHSASKIVHRDLKPANILFNSQGRAKISDFGLARRTKNTTLNTERLGAGTLPYMAPELLASAHSGAYKLAPTNRVDIYSLAMIMWEMLSGQQPWVSKSEVNIMAAVIRNRRPELPHCTTSEPVDPAAMDLAGLPASLTALPDFNALVRECWNQRELKRPTALALFSKLAVLMTRFGLQVDPSLGTPAAVAADSSTHSGHTTSSSAR